MLYVPSVMATAVMLYIIDGVEPSLAAEYQSQLLGILGIDKVSRFTLTSLTSILFCSHIESENVIVYALLYWISIMSNRTW